MNKGRKDELSSDGRTFIMRGAILIGLSILGATIFFIKTKDNLSWVPENSQIYRANIDKIYDIEVGIAPPDKNKNRTINDTWIHPSSDDILTPPQTNDENFSIDDNLETKENNLKKTNENIEYHYRVSISYKIKHRQYYTELIFHATEKNVSEGDTLGIRLVEDQPTKIYNTIYKSNGIYSNDEDIKSEKSFTFHYHLICGIFSLIGFVLILVGTYHHKNYILNSQSEESTK